MVLSVAALAFTEKQEGVERIRLTMASDDSRDSRYASISADGTLVAFSSDSDLLGQGIEDEQSEIWLYDVNSGNLTRVTNAPDSSRDSYTPNLSAVGEIFSP